MCVSFVCQFEKKKFLFPIEGYDLRSSNMNSALLDDMKTDKIPDIVLVRKIYDRSMRQDRRNWKLKRLIQNDSASCDSSSTRNEFEAWLIFLLEKKKLIIDLFFLQDFLDDLEEDEKMRQEVNIYRDNAKKAVCSKDVASDLPPGIPLHEILEDLDLNTDVEVK